MRQATSLKVSLIAILAAAFLRLSRGSTICGTVKHLLVRNGSAFTVQCRSSNFSTLAQVLWTEEMVISCEVAPKFSLPSNNSRWASKVGGCSPTVDVNVTLHSASFDPNLHTVYCEYTSFCNEEYNLLVYDAGSLKLETKYKAAGITLNATNSSTNPTKAEPLVVSAEDWSSAQFSFNCSFEKCSSTNNAVFAWYTTTSTQNGTISGTWKDTTDANGQKCQYYNQVNNGEDQSFTQLSGDYKPYSTYTWSASAFLQAAFNLSPSTLQTSCTTQTVTVNVGCVSQFQVHSSPQKFSWSNDTVNDAVWQTIIFTCPAKNAAASAASSSASSSLSQSELIGIVVGIIAAAIVVTVVTCVIIRARRSRSHQPVAQDDYTRAATANNNNNSNNRFEKSPPITA